MKLANKALIISLTILAMMLSISAQTLRPDSDPRNLAPTVGTGGPPGGATGLFTVYDGQTLRKGEFTFSAAYSNYDRDPGDVDIVEVPLSFQVGVADYLELFFNTDAYRAMKVNSPRNLSGFYLPNSQLNIGGVRTSGPAIILGPSGRFNNQTIFRPTGSQPFVNYPYFGGFAPNIGGFGPFVLGPSSPGGNGAANFTGIGSPFGSILPGVVLQTTRVAVNPAFPNITTEVPTVFSVAPSYLPDAPFLNREYGESAFNTFTVGAKIRFTGPRNPVGIGVIPFYRFYADRATSRDGFNQLNRGASPGSKRGDFGAVLFADVRARKWVNVSANIGYIYNGDVKGLSLTGNETILDRGDEVLAGIGLDFPVNKYFQPILEFRSTQYVGGRTPNAFENSPLDGLAGARVFPTRYLGFGFAYRYHFNQQDRDSFDNDDNAFTTTVTVPGFAPINNSFNGVPPGFRPSTDPHGFIIQAWVGRRNKRLAERVNLVPNVDSLILSDNTVYLPCPPGTSSASGKCSDEMMVNATTSATDPENDVLTYEYTVSGGRIVGSGANVNWDLSGVRPGTYTITAGVNDGCGICGQTKTETITVAECDDCVPGCEDCPSVSVTGPRDVVGIGESMTFSANVSGNSNAVTYNWSVDQGTITEGQGTPVITVDTTGLEDTTITATVTLGNLCDTCPEASDSETGVISGNPLPDLINQIGNVANDEVRQEIDNLFIRLQNNPSVTGYILTYGSQRDINRREKLIRDHIRLRRYDSSRVVLLSNADGSEIRSDVYLVPQGAVPPRP